MEYDGQSSYLEQIAMDLVIKIKNNKSPVSPASLLEQEIEHTLEQLRELKEQGANKNRHQYQLQQDHYDIMKYTQSNQYDNQSIDSYICRPYDIEKQKISYITNTWQMRRSDTHEVSIQELLHKLCFLLNKHKQSSSGHLLDYWTGSFS